ncbi:hypothetical protein ACVWZM_007962 [Bradyrhizobium sp. USDA 4501]|nr:hypothetical protein [Bradyrhizobium sp. USDA 4541]
MYRIYYFAVFLAVTGAVFGSLVTLEIFHSMGSA